MRWSNQWRGRKHDGHERHSTGGAAACSAGGSGLGSNGGPPLTFAATGNLTVVGGTLDFGGNTQHISATATVSLQGGTVQNGTISKSGTAYDGQSGVVTATLAGTAGLTKTGYGTLTLAGTDTYTGTDHDQPR